MIEPTTRRDAAPPSADSDGIIAAGFFCVVLIFVTRVLF